MGYCFIYNSQNNKNLIVFTVNSFCISNLLGLKGIVNNSNEVGALFKIL